ncbi:MAG: isoprenylcysteine carboxylmethyltransferase family protein [Anaerolineae bacterium]|nr:isoprenylcysteine carboxylmethyltransferase family protein [Anaerolineae bacterium]
MSAGMKAVFLYWIAGASLIAAWMLPGLLGTRHRFQALRGAGWGIWTVAVGLIWASILSLRSKGVAQEGEDEACTSITVDGGIYAIIRHPRYLGWLLVYVAVMMLTQHWLAVTFAIPGMACVYLISRREDRRLVEEFGPAYEQYMQCVPALNLVAGLTRLLRRRAKRPPGAGAEPTGHSPEEDPA